MGVQHRVKSVTTCAFERQNVYTSDIPVVLDRTTCKRCWGNVVHDLPVSSWECAGLRRNHSPHRQHGPRLWQRHAVRLKRVARRAFRLDFVQSILAGFQVVILAALCLQRMPHVMYFGIGVRVRVRASSLPTAHAICYTRMAARQQKKKNKTF